MGQSLYGWITTNHLDELLFQSIGKVGLVQFGGGEDIRFQSSRRRRHHHRRRDA
jgi:hypothetical protein